MLCYAVLCRFRRRSAAAASAASALSEGAAALAALGQKEDAFYGQVARLQRYWKVGGCVCVLGWLWVSAWTCDGLWVT